MASSFLPQTRFQNPSKIGLFRSDFGASFCRSMSTANGGSGHSDIADLVSENAVQAVASSSPAAVVNEVAVAAANSSYPEYLSQQFIDAVHCYTGFNWWSSVVIATLLYRGVIVLPINIYLRYAKFMVERDHADKVEELRERFQSAKNVTEYAKILNECFAFTFRPAMAFSILGVIHVSFSSGILNMVGKVPSFKTGGAFWFLDLSTPDPLLIFPVLMALLLCIRLREMELDNSTNLALMSIPFTMFMPKALLLSMMAYTILDIPAGKLESYLLKKAGCISS